MNSRVPRVQTLVAARELREDPEAQSVTMGPPPFIVPDSIEHRLRLALERDEFVRAADAYSDKPARRSDWVSRARRSNRRSAPSRSTRVDSGRGRPRTSEMFQQYLSCQLQKQGA